MNRWLFFWRKMRRQLWVRATAYNPNGFVQAALTVQGQVGLQEQLASYVQNEIVTLVNQSGRSVFQNVDHTVREGFEPIATTGSLRVLRKPR